ASGSAPEAVIDLLRRRHRERRGLLGVKRAQADERVGSGLLEGEVAGDQRDQVSPLPDRLNVLRPDPSCHPTPPALTAASPGEGRAVRRPAGRTDRSCPRCSRRRGSAGLPEPDGTPPGPGPDGPGNGRTVSGQARWPCPARTGPHRADTPARTGSPEGSPGLERPRRTSGSPANPRSGPPGRVQ